MIVWDSIKLKQFLGRLSKIVRVNSSDMKTIINSLLEDERMKSQFKRPYSCLCLGSSIDLSRLGESSIGNSYVDFTTFKDEIKEKESSFSNERCVGDSNYEIVKEGYLLVQNRSIWTLPSHYWKNRYFCLSNEALRFYKKGTEEQATTHKIPLDKYVKLYPEESRSKHFGKQFYIKVVKRRKVYTLCASSEEERNSWLTALLTAIANNIILQKPRDLSGSTSRIGSCSEVELSEGDETPELVRRRRVSLSVPQRHSWFSLPERSNGKVNENWDKNDTTSLFKAVSMFNLTENAKYNPRNSYVVLNI